MLERDRQEDGKEKMRLEELKTRKLQGEVLSVAEEQLLQALEEKQ